MSMSRQRGERSLKKQAGAGTQDVGGAFHQPVLLQEAVALLVTDPTGIYVDGTIGGGGHTAAILQRLQPGGKVYGFDLDEDAIAHCQHRFAREIAAGRLILIHASYRKACSIQEERKAPFLAGLLLDLGVSSYQLDVGRKGWSYRVDARLDMRFGPHGQPAEDLLASCSEQELIRIFRIYGEEPLAAKIARAIVQRRQQAPIRTTFDLRDAVAAVVPKARLRKTLSRIFQALRIAVNEELQVLEETLRCVIPQLQSGGRIVVISYHSLEDRIVKMVFREYARARRPTEDNPYATWEPVQPQLRILTKRPIVPSPEEIARNPRARSAKLRAAEKLPG